jgi:hypothetical protein
VSTRPAVDCPMLRPDTQKACNTRRCTTFSYQLSEWGACEPSTVPGKCGLQTRVVTCLATSATGRCFGQQRPMERLRVLPGGPWVGFTHTYSRTTTTTTI